MATTFFTLVNPSRRRFGTPQWLIRFPPWFHRDFDMDAGGLLRDLWNPLAYAFSTPAMPENPVEKRDFPAVVGDWLACSRSMADTITSVAPDSIEFLPFRTRTSIGTDQTDAYSVMHFTTWCSAIDRKASRLAAGETKFRRIAGFTRDFLLDHVVLSRKKLTRPICRVIGWSPYYLFREDIVDLLRRRGFTGLEFDPVECL